MTARPLRTALAAFGVLLLQGVAVQAEPFALSGTEDKLPLETIDYFETADTSLTPERIEGEWRHAFRPTARSDLTRGYSARAHWLRLEITNASRDPLTRWLEIGHSRLERVSLFDRIPGGWRESAAGTQVPRRDRAVVAGSVVLPLTLPAGETRLFLVRVRSETAVEVPVTIWEPLAFRAAEAGLQSLQSLILGAIGLAAAFSLLTFLLIRSREHMFLGLGLLSFLLYESSIDGLLIKYVWPSERPFWTWTISIWAACFLSSLLLFYRKFLDLRRYLPFWDKACLALAGGTIPLVAEEILRDHYSLSAQINVVIGGVTIVAGVVLGLAVLIKGHRVAPWFMAGMGTLWLSAAPFLLANIGLIEQNPLFGLSLPFAFVIVSVLALAAISDRLKQLWQEKEQADAEAISRLETLVGERTHDLERALAEANAANRAKTDFLARISHDLRTPLHTIIGYAQMLQRESRRIRPKEGAGAIEGSARRLLALIDELLDYVRGEIGRLRLDPRPIYWHGLVERILTDARHLCEAASNQFRFEEQGSFPVAIVVDERRLRQVLDNLLSNANRHTVNGVVKLNVTGRIGTEVRLGFLVEDTGTGIPPDKVADIFKPFVSGSNGTGLGLAISRQLASALGGELRLERTSAQGSSFAFHISCPLADEADVALPALVTRYASGYGGRRRTILVAEDVAENRHFLDELLAEAGFDVLAVSSGYEALNLLGNDVDMVLTDQSMPDGDGWAVLRGVRERTPNLPVVLISAAPPRVPEGFPPDLTFSAMLLKPVDCDALLETLGRLLNLEWRADEPTDIAGPRPSPLQLPRADAAWLLRLIDSGDVTGMEEMSHDLKARGGPYAEIADAIHEAATRLDFEFLRQTAGAGTGERLTST